MAAKRFVLHFIVNEANCAEPIVVVAAPLAGAEPLLDRPFLQMPADFGLKEAAEEVRGDGDRDNVTNVISVSERLKGNANDNVIAQRRPAAVAAVDCSVELDSQQLVLAPIIGRVDAADDAGSDGNLVAAHRISDNLHVLLEVWYAVEGANVRESLEAAGGGRGCVELSRRRGSSCGI